MNLNLFVITITCLTGVISWTLENVIKDKIEAINSIIEDGTNKITDFAKDVDAGANIVFNSVQDYVENQEKKLTDGFYEYVASLQEKQEMVERQFDNYVATVKETERKAKETFSGLVENNDSINPDLNLTVPEMIERHGYTCETHIVISHGYILNIHRIPKSKNASKISEKTVLLHHGLFASSADWILNGPGKGLAYVLSDAGYDVWMPNIRGNKYSREHEYLSVESEEYWDFSWHDVASNDIPKIIDYIKKLKSSHTEIVYIGHSMGTTLLFTMLTVRPEYNNVLKAGYALAPVVFFTNLNSPIKSLAPMASNVAYLDKLYGSHEFVPKNSALGRITRACSADSLDSYLCSNAIFFLCGYNEEQFNKTLLPVFLAHIGTGTSWKTIVHFSQLIASGKFQQFDYGSIENIVKYGAIKPPEYDLSKITLPVSLFWAKNDLLSSEEDVMLLKNKLTTRTRTYLVPDPKFNHLDYIWAVDIKVLLNDKILEYLHEDFKD